LSYEQPILVDDEALKRSIECKDLLNLRMAQLDEKARFLEFQTSMLVQLRSQRESIKAQRRGEHEKILAEQSRKVGPRRHSLAGNLMGLTHAQNDRSLEDLEARQLEEEMKLQKEHELEKRTVMVRLRHMEAYCQNPSPPPTPVHPASGRLSTDSSVLPERKVTDKDYHSLAQQYRERDAMDTLHASKINVLRGKQKKAVENLMRKKGRELERLEATQGNELAAVDQDFATQEANLRLALGVKRARLEARWRTQALIERTKMEHATGLKYGPMPDVLAVEESSHLPLGFTVHQGL
jgi:hypothetical protein